MSEQRAREIFAEELRREGANNLADMILSGADNSQGGKAAIRAIVRACEEVADREYQRGRDAANDENWADDQ